MKVRDGWVVCRRIMPSTKRLSTKFHSFPRSFASRPAAQLFSFSFGRYLSIHQQAVKGFIYFKTLQIISQSEHTKITPAHFMDFFMFLCAELSTSISFLRH